jgi:hypothetical protein
MTTQTYAAKIDGWIAGRRRKQGDLLTLTEDQARHEPVLPVALQVQGDAASSDATNPVEQPLQAAVKATRRKPARKVAP